MRTVMLCVLMLLSFGTALCAIPAGAQPPVVLRGEKVAVEAEYREGRLRERYLAIHGGAWIEVATGEGRSIGPVSVVVEGGKSLPGTVRNISVGRRGSGRRADSGPAPPHPQADHHRRWLMDSRGYTV